MMDWLVMPDWSAIMAGPLLAQAGFALFILTPWLVGCIWLAARFTRIFGKPSRQVRLREDARR